MFTAMRERDKEARRAKPARCTSLTRKKALVFTGATVTPSTMRGSSKVAAYSLFKSAFFESMRSTVRMAISVPIGSVML
jgi:hypothetical protein